MTQRSLLALVADEREKLIKPWIAAHASHNTQRAYERIISAMEAHLAGRSFMRVDVSDVAQVLNLFRSSQASANVARSALASFFDFHISNGTKLYGLHFITNPTSSFRTKAVKRGASHKIPTYEIYANMLKAENVFRNRLMLHCAFILGLRNEEIVGLQVVCFFLGTDGFSYVKIIGKGQRVREVQVPEWLMLEFKEYFGSENLTDEDYLFFHPNNKSQALSDRQSFRIITEMGERVGYHELGPHMWRRGHATTAVEHGASLKSLLDSMGHSSLQTLQRYMEEARVQSPTGFIPAPIKEVLPLSPSLDSTEVTKYGR